MWTIPDMVEFPKAEQNSLKPTINDEESKQKQFGIELAKGLNPFEAACLVCGNDTKIALYISQRWLNEPIVLASKDLYLKTVYNSNELLDGDELAARLLEMADERDRNNLFYMLEGKDRIKCLELYAKIRGLDKTVIDQSKSFTFNKMVVKFVSPNKEEKIVDELPNEEKLLNTKLPPLKLKLVSAS